MNIEDLIIDEQMSAIDAMKKLDAAGRRIVFIAPGGVLQAVLTDSDVRKYILRGGDLHQPVRQVANYAPKFLPVDRRREAKLFLKHHSIDAVPLLDKEGCIADIVFANEPGVSARRRLNTPVVIMAGGRGTRLYPYTKILPKPLIPVGEVPITELVIEKFRNYGCAGFTLIVNYKKNMIKSYFAELEKDYELAYVEEEEPLGTGGGLSLLQGEIEETFFFTNCDILIDADYRDIERFHKKRGNTITMVCAAKQFVIPYGVVELDEEGCLSGIREKPEMNFLTNTGMYVVEPSVLDAIPKGVPQGFTDIIDTCRQNGGRVGIYPISEDSWMDMGQLEELDKMRRRLGAAE